MKKILSVTLLSLSIFGSCYAADTAPARVNPAWLTQARASIKADKYDQQIGIIYLAIVFVKSSPRI